MNTGIDARVSVLTACVVGWLLCISATRAAADGEFDVGVAKVDITPEYPIRLSGYGGCPGPAIVA